MSGGGLCTFFSPYADSRSSDSAGGSPRTAHPQTCARARWLVSMLLRVSACAVRKDDVIDMENEKGMRVVR